MARTQMTEPSDSMVRNLHGYPEIKCVHPRTPTSSGIAVSLLVPIVGKYLECLAQRAPDRRAIVPWSRRDEFDALNRPALQQLGRGLLLVCERVAHEQRHESSLSLASDPDAPGASIEPSPV